MGAKCFRCGRGGEMKETPPKEELEKFRYLNDIRNYYKVTHYTTVRWLQERGLKLLGRRKIFEEGFLEKFSEDCKTMSGKELALKYGASTATISKWKRKFGIKN